MAILGNSSVFNSKFSPPSVVFQMPPPADPTNFIPAQTAVDSAVVTPLDLTPFFDDVDADPLTLTIDPADLPAGLTFNGTMISGTPDADASQGGMNGVYEIPVLVDDGNGGTFTTNVTYTVTNPVPVVDTAVVAEVAVVVVAAVGAASLSVLAESSASVWS